MSLKFLKNQKARATDNYTIGTDGEAILELESVVSLEAQRLSYVIEILKAKGILLGYSLLPSALDAKQIKGLEPEATEDVIWLTIQEARTIIDFVTVSKSYKTIGDQRAFPAMHTLANVLKDLVTELEADK